MSTTGEFWKKRRFYSVGQVAALFGVSERTAANWIDRGHLIGFRLPGTLDRRVTHGELCKFMARHAEFGVFPDETWGPGWDEPIPVRDPRAGQPLNQGRPD